MSEHLDLLQRAASRGTPRGIDRVFADARHRLRRRRQQVFGLVAGVAVLGAGLMTAGLDDGDSTTAVASSQDDDFVAVVLDPDRFELVTGTEPESWEYPESRLGNITIYQRLDEDGSVTAAAAVAVVDSTRQQSTLLDVRPLEEGTADGDNGTYRLGHHDLVTNGLVIVERATPTHTIRVAGRHLDVPATVKILESVELTAEGEIAQIELPDGLPAVPTYDGPDISRIGLLPALSTSGHYRDRDTGQNLTIVTERDGSVLPSETLAWWYIDGTVLSENAPPTVIGEDHESYVAHWRLDARSWVRMFSDAPLTTDLIRQVQTESRAVDATAWADLIKDRTLREQTTETEPPTTTTTP